MTWRVEHGDCVEVLAAMDEASVDAVVCDPPYGLEFMGKDWDRLSGQPGYVERGRITDRPDAQVPYGRGGGVNSYQAGRPMQAWHEAWAREALRVLKPGGHLLAFGGTRTYHRLACAIEDAGFEVRDCIAWLYGSGFPKSLNLEGDHAGWGTALKPAFEPIVVARKPLGGTVAANVLKHGTGALNVDGCRIGTDEIAAHGGGQNTPGSRTYGNGAGIPALEAGANPHTGRWPANVVMDPEAGAMLDEQSGELTSGANPERRGSDKFRTAYGDFVGQEECVPARGTDRGGASRFFYCAKASTAERNAGLDHLPVSDAAVALTPTSTLANGRSGGRRVDDRESVRASGANVHPTVKPIDLMRWLVRLVTPPKGLVLDPFGGSGTTGCAAVLEGFDFVGVERDDQYVELARARIQWWSEQPDDIDVDAAVAGDGARRKVAESGQGTLL